RPENLETIGCAVLESLQRLDENDYSPGISVCKIIYFFELLKKNSRVSVKFGRKKQGFLDFDKGVLINASCENKKGSEALLEIFDWPPLGFTMIIAAGKRERTLTPNDLETIRITSRLKKEAAMKDTVRSGPNRLSAVNASNQQIALFIVDDSRMMRKVIDNFFIRNQSKCIFAKILVLGCCFF
ncbi:MAG: hypothetical protein D3923_06355, partial [Candidatus Electrothrix sp. AR3]|nr:hypothetical protein [Candidatus Electrothrix sp. AR3]